MRISGRDTEKRMQASGRDTGTYDHNYFVLEVQSAPHMLFQFTLHLLDIIEVDYRTPELISGKCPSKHGYCYCFLI